MKNVLLIVAAGKSSRFGGYPKALCMLKDTMNVDNTVKYARRFFDEVYLGLNVETVKKFSDLKTDARILSIETGQGDSLSLLKMIRLIREEDKELQKIYVCWGDAFFVDEKPFTQFAEKIEDKQFYVACSIDEKPYAWFDVDEDDNVVRSHFKKIDGEIEKGIHDQSLFCFDIDAYIRYINEYKDSIGLLSEDYDENETKEAKLLDLFIYLYEHGNPVKSVLIDKNRVLSFNTREELDKIVEEYC